MSSNVLVVVHVYYPELWEQISFCISNLDRLNKCYDLYVTIPEKLRFFSSHILEFNKKANIIITENVGYDIWPFIKVLNCVELDKYDYIIKLHTKRSLGMTVVSTCNKYFFIGKTWRTLLLSFISKKRNLESVFCAFEKDASLGMVNSNKIIEETVLPSKDAHYSYCAENAIDIINKLIPYNSNCIKFVAGSMFICRAKPLKLLKELDYDLKDFIKVDRDKVNDLPHILERVFGGLITVQGYKIYDPFSSIWDNVFFIPYSVLCRLLSIRIVKKIIRFIFRIDGHYNEDKIIRIFKIKILRLKRKE